MQVKSGGAPPHSKRLRDCKNDRTSRQRFGVRRCSGAFARWSGQLDCKKKRRYLVSFCFLGLKGELLQKITKETKMFESLMEELAECTPRCRVDSHAGEKRWSTTA